MPVLHIFISVLLISFCSSLNAAENTVGAGAVILTPIADTYIATYPPGRRDARAKNSEQGGNAGKTLRLKIKKYENIPLFKFDFSAIPKGATINKAYIDIKLMNGAQLNQITVSSIHADWNEGNGTFDDGKNYDLNHEGACLFGPKGINSSWRSFANSDFYFMYNGEGGSAMRIVKATMLDDGTCRIPVDPYVLHAAIENGSSLAFTDHTATFTGDGANIFFHSREVAGKEPKLTVTWSMSKDQSAPAFKSIALAEAGPVPGSIRLALPAAGDDGDKGTALGYRVWVNDKQIPVVDLPRPQRIWRNCILEGFEPSAALAIKIEAFDEANNTCTTTITTKSTGAFTGALADALADQNAEGQKVSSADFSAQLIDGMTLINPLTGTLSVKQQRGKGLLPIKRFGAVKGEAVGLQCLINAKTPQQGLRISASDLKNDKHLIPASQIEFFNEVYVKMENNWIADILPQLNAGDTFSIPSQKDLSTQQAHCIYIDVWVPKTAAAGLYAGTITVQSSEETIELPLEIMVRDITLPDELSFTVEMNAYGHSSDKKVFHETYRLCHKHRLSYNVLGYGHWNPRSKTTPVLNSDANPDIAAKDVKITDWSVYDEFYGPIFSGALTKDLPRAGIPATHWYLPFQSSWPYLLEKCNPHLWKSRVKPNDDKKAYIAWEQYLAENDLMFDDHLSADWHLVNKNVAQQFKDHFKEKGWTKTKMQIFDNHKMYFASGSRSLWVMDEPRYGRDYEALAGIYKAHESYLGGGSINTQMRADISTPQKMGMFMDGGMDEVVVSSAINLYSAYLRNYNSANGTTLWWYGGGSEADNDPAAVIALFTNKWSLGCVGGMPVYTSFAGSNDWTKSHRLRVVRFAEGSGLPVASFRMKAYRRAQQDMELFNLLAQKDGFNRWHVADLINKEVVLKMTTISTRPDDPGYSTFEGLDLANFDALREKVVATLLAK